MALARSFAAFSYGSDNGQLFRVDRVHHRSIHNGKIHLPITAQVAAELHILGQKLMIALSRMRAYFFDSA
jgi:hypothetical protein